MALIRADLESSPSSSESFLFFLGILPNVHLSRFVRVDPGLLPFCLSVRHCSSVGSESLSESWLRRGSARIYQSPRLPFSGSLFRIAFPGRFSDFPGAGRQTEGDGGGAKVIDGMRGVGRGREGERGRKRDRGRERDGWRERDSESSTAPAHPSRR